MKVRDAVLQAVEVAGYSQSKGIDVAVCGSLALRLADKSEEEVGDIDLVIEARYLPKVIQRWKEWGYKDWKITNCDKYAWSDESYPYLHFQLTEKICLFAIGYPLVVESCQGVACQEIKTVREIKKAMDKHRGKSDVAVAEEDLWDLL